MNEESLRLRNDSSLFKKKKIKGETNQIRSQRDKKVKNRNITPLLELRIPDSISFLLELRTLAVVSVRSSALGTSNSS
jgi:hypothetical protein